MDGSVTSGGFSIGLHLCADGGISNSCCAGIPPRQCLSNFLASVVWREETYREPDTLLRRGITHLPFCTQLWSGSQAELLKLAEKLHRWGPRPFRQPPVWAFSWMESASGGTALHLLLRSGKLGVGRTGSSLRGARSFALRDSLSLLCPSGCWNLCTRTGLQLCVEKQKLGDFLCGRMKKVPGADSSTQLSSARKIIRLSASTIEEGFIYEWLQARLDLGGRIHTPQFRAGKHGSETMGLGGQLNCAARRTPCITGALQARGQSIRPWARLFW